MSNLIESYKYWESLVLSLFRAEPPIPIEERLSKRMLKEFSESDWGNPDKELEISVKEHYELWDLYRKAAIEWGVDIDPKEKPTMFSGFKLKVK